MAVRSVTATLSKWLGVLAVPPHVFTRLQPRSATNTRNHYLLGLRTLDYLLLGLLLLGIASAVTYAVPANGRAVYQFFRLNSDNNVPAWYSSILLAMGALLAFECRATAHAADARKAFLILGALLLLMSCDEVVRLHETIPEFLANTLGLNKREWFKGRPWLLLGAPFVLALLLWVLLKVDRVVRGRPRERLTLLLGFMAIVLGGLVFEALALLTSNGSLARFVLVYLEESLEMLGTLLICASLVLIRDRQLSS